MDRYATLVGNRGDTRGLLRRQGNPAISIVGILDADDRCPGSVDIGWSNRRPDHLGVDHPVDVWNGPELYGADDGAPGDFVMKDVRLIAADDFVAALGVSHDANEVALGTRGNQHGG